MQKSARSTPGSRDLEHIATIKFDTVNNLSGPALNSDPLTGEDPINTVRRSRASVKLLCRAFQTQSATQLPFRIISFPGFQLCFVLLCKTKSGVKRI